jgi:organic radical activating enzyme
MTTVATSTTATTTPQPTVEWQVCGTCNYDCSYCIQKKASRVGHPDPEMVEGFLTGLAALPGRWEIKMTGGEPFAFRAFIDRIIPELVARTSHTISVLTNLSAPLRVLDRFAELTRGRLGIVSASLHLEHESADAFVAKAVHLREVMDPAARLVINTVLVPGRLAALREAEAKVRAAGLKLFPQIMKVKHGIASYDDDDQATILQMVGKAPTPRDANMAPSYRGRRCWAGAKYFVLTQTGDAWACRTARRHGEGFMGNLLDGSFRLGGEPKPCTYDICPCTVPANRGMIEGVA